MKQMDVPADKKVYMDFEDEKRTEAVRTLRPLVYREKNSICCILGPNINEGVFGQGATKEEALTNWETNLRKRIIYHTPGDEVARFIEDSLNASNKDVW